MTVEYTEKIIIADLTDPIVEICKRYPTKRSAIMPALFLAQEKYGTVDETSYKAIAEILDIPQIWISEVASFYTMYNRKAVGKHHLQLCTNVSCMLLGAYELRDYLQEKLSINNGDATSDGLFTFSCVECIGSCDVAPAMMINQAYHENLSKEKLDDIIAQLSEMETT